jgi:hypothetical protein
MMIQIYGFDWDAYVGIVMPAFANWLVEGEESATYQLYLQTRCAREEQYIPPMLRPVRTWTRALAFVQRLPRGAQTCEEYKILCDAEQFTALSDQYLHRHSPQLYPHAEALRAVWGAIVEEHCQSYFALPGDGDLQEREGKVAGYPTDKDDVAALLFSSVFDQSSREGKEQKSRKQKIKSTKNVDNMGEPWLDDDREEEPREKKVQGTKLGRHPAPLHLRGWLASRSVRGMALFELLACGRRCLPFGSRAGEPYEDYIGYLTPGEVWQLANSLRHEHVARQTVEAEADYLRFRQSRRSRSPEEFRMIDEVLPSHADAFLDVIRMAAQYELGLLCRMG